MDLFNLSQKNRYDCTQESVNRHRVPSGGQARTYLRELKLGDIELLHDLIPEHVGGGEKPTPPAALLIGSWASLKIDHMVEHMLVGNLGSAVQ